MDFRKAEKKWQKLWEEKGIFKAKRGKGKKLFVTVPYPYTSGPLHIGHARTYTLADIWTRFKRMQGYNVLFPMAFHISGTPILSVSDRIRESKGETIALYREYVSLYEKDRNRAQEIVETFNDPKAVAKYFARVISRDFKLLGFSIDWTRTFNTGDPRYQKFIEWQFLTLKKKGLVKRGEHAVQFCPRDDNAVGEDDIKDGDVLDTRIETLTLVKFPFKDGFLPAATLRPETIFGATNIWINPKRPYVKAKVDGEVWYVSREGLAKLENQNHRIKKLEEFPGKDLINKKASSPVEKRELPVLPAKFVDTSFATGVVYSVPAHSPDDFIALRDLKSNINPISILELPGFEKIPAKYIVEKMGIKSQQEREKLKEATKILYKQEFYNGVLKNCKQFSGVKIRNVKDSVKLWLKKGGKAMDFFASQTPNLQCRCGEKVIVKVLPDQWFIDYGNQKWKSLARKCLKKMSIMPEMYRTSFDSTIDWLHERACARKRGLGTALPWDNGWVIESLSDSTIYPAFYTIVKGLQKNKIPPSKLKPELFDYLFLGKGKANETNRATGIKKSILEEIRKEFEYWYPVDERHTAIPHLSNHLTFYIFNHTIIFPEKHWPKMISLNELLIREGSKMSKSKGNVVPLADIEKKYSADLYRLYMAYGADMNAVIDWTDKGIETVRKKLNAFTVIADKTTKMNGKEKGIDSWLVSRFNTTLKEAKKDIESFNFRKYTNEVFFEMINDVSHYFRRGGNSFIIRNILKDWIKILSPVIPHTCEELWEKLGEKPFVSLQKWPEANEKFINPKLEKREELIMQTLSDIKEIIRLIKKSPKKIHIYIAPIWKYEVYKTLLKGVKDKKHAISRIMKNPEIRKHGKDAVHFSEEILRTAGNLSDIMGQEYEYKSLSEATDFIKKGIGAEKVHVWKEEDKNKHDPQKKARNAKPMKPAIYLE